MDALEIRPFDEGDLPAAGRLLAERHRHQRAAQPLLSPRYEDAAAAEAEVAAAWKGDGASGVVGLRGGEVVGYLIGAGKSPGTWGENVWVESAGMAVSEPEDVRELYAVAATRWVEEGRTAQYAVVPASDHALVGAWFRLAFGHQHTHAVRTLPTTPPALPTGITVRPPTRDDIPVLARLERVLPQHQGLAPTFSAGHLPTYEEALAEWEADFDDPSYATFVAEARGHVVGSAVGVALEKSGSHVGPARLDNAGFLSFAAVLPEARGLGAGRALGQAVMTWAAEAGFDCLVTDWRETNLLSSRAWRGLGFQDTFIRVHRQIAH